MKKDSLVEETMINSATEAGKELIGHCPYCGHHININQSIRNGYCPLCDKVLTQDEIEQLPSEA